jgi:membrane protease subunit (stomatin/prohibitin family)
MFGFLTNEFIEIIEWQQKNEDDTLCWKFPHRNNSIKNGAKLIVREGQRALFLSMGALPAANLPPQMVAIETAGGQAHGFIGDSFGPGTYTLETKVLPILGTLQGWKHGFESPFKADIYYVSTRRFTGMKWGTQNPIMIRDAEFGPVRVRAFGSYAIQVSDPVKLLRELVSTDPSLQTYEIAEQLRSSVVTRFTQAVAGAGIPVLDMAASLDQFSGIIQKKLNEEFSSMGLSFPMFVVENISLPPELEEVLDKRSSMGILGNLDQYAKLQAANAITMAASNPGGGAGVGMGLGAGMAIGQQVAGAFASQPQAAPPPLPAAAQWFAGVNGQQVGPMDAAAFQGAVAQGRISRDTLVWKAGMAGWVAAGTVQELAAFFASVPPPLPPAL